METKTRSIVKSIIWRIIGIILLIVIAYFVTGDLKEMTIITILFHAIRMAMYYFHERIWQHISWGKEKHPLASIPVTKNLKPQDQKIIEDKLRDLGYLD